MKIIKESIFIQAWENDALVASKTIGIIQFNQIRKEPTAIYRMEGGILDFYSESSIVRFCEHNRISEFQINS